MPKSRILIAAERLRTVGSTLNNPDDVAITEKYVEDLEALATREIPTRSVMRSATPEEERAAILGGALKQVFPVDHEPRFSHILRSLDLTKDRDA